MAGQNLVVYVDIAGVAVFDFMTGRLGIVDMVNVAGTFASKNICTHEENACAAGYGWGRGVGYGYFIL